MPDKKKKKKSSRRRSRTPQALLSAALLVVVFAVALLAGAFAPDGSAGTDRSAYGSLPRGESDLRLNELMASNTATLALEDGSWPDWIELLNTGEEALPLQGYALMSNGDPSTLSRLPAGTLGAGEALVLYADGHASADGLHLPFKLSSAGETVSLLDPSGLEVDAVSTPKLEVDQVYARGGDGSWSVSDTATPGADNEIIAPGSAEAVQRSLTAVPNGEVIVTEVMTRSATYLRGSDGQALDYVEVKNVSAKPVQLEGWRLSDDPAVPAKWRFPDVELAPGACLLVRCSGMDRHDSQDDLHASFRLAGEGETVLLSRPDGTATSVVEVPQLNADQAWSLVDGSWTDGFAPTPGLDNTMTNAWAAGDALLGESRSALRISELSATATDDTPDWIELYNAGSEPIDLGDYALSDNAKNPGKWCFPAGRVVAPGQYTGVLCSGAASDEGDWPQAGFKLSASGGYTLVLSRRSGARYEQIDRVFVPQQYEGITYGRLDDQLGFYYFEKGTPLTRNTGTAYAGKAETATYSVPGGLFTTGQTFTVALSAQPGARIHYTLDSSDPTESSPVYTGPITVSDTTVLRTRVYADGYLPSWMDTQTYLYNVNNAGVFVVSLVSDKVGLFSSETGMMVKGPNASSTFPYKGANFLKDWEREAHVEIYAGDGSQVLSQECGIKLQGLHSRSLDQKAFKVIARNKYGSSLFHMSLFSKRPYTEYQSFILRAGGQDAKRTRIRDSILTALAADTSLLYQETEVAVLYLDGEYYGLFNLRERINAYSICRHEGWEGQEDAIDIGESNSSTVQGDCSSYAKLVEYCKTADTTTDEFYALLDRAIDIRSYIEYIAIQMYVGNGDTNNVKRYRNANADGKWRWVLFDLDGGFMTDTNSINRWLTPGGVGYYQKTDNSMFIACMKNPRFRDEFLTYMGEQMATTFSSEHIVSMIDERMAIIGPIIGDQLARWDVKESAYKREINRLYNYAKSRPLKLLGYFKTCDYLKLSTDEMYRYFGEALRVAQEYEASGN